MLIHTVSAGEDLAAVAAQYGLTAAYLERLNHLPNPGNLVPGQTLLVTSPAIMHTTAPGENLYTIAALYAVTTTQLLRNNPFLTRREIRTGDRLIIAYEGQPQNAAILLGYTYPTISPGPLREMLPYLTYLSIFTTRFLADGALVLPNDAPLLGLARSMGTGPLLHLSNVDETGRFDTALAHTILTDLTIQETLLDQLLNVLSAKAYVGVDVDFEFLMAEDTDRFVFFLRRLHDLLNKNGKILLADLAPKSYDDQSGLLVEGLDYQAIGAAVDYVFLMTYEWGYAGGPPMAVAPLPQIQEVLRYASRSIAKEKLLLGLPWYGYRWSVPYAPQNPPAQSLSLDDAISLAAQHHASISFDLEAKVPYYDFEEAGETSLVFFDDVQSMSLKIHQTKLFSLAGAGIWNITRPWLQGFALLNQQLALLKTPIPTQRL